MVWRTEFSATLSSGKRIFGWYGILEKLSRNKSGFFLHYRGKGIAGVVPVLLGDNGKGGHESEGAKDAIARASYKPRKIFGSPGMYLDQSWVGEFDVSDFGKTISTDSPLWSSEEESEFIDALYEHMKKNPQPERNFFKMAGTYLRRKVMQEAQRELLESQQQESKRIESAMNDTVSHVDASTLPLMEYGAPPVVLVEDSEGEDESERPQHFSIRDRDGHEHTFTLQFIADRSADFIALFESAGRFNHVVQVNRLHPILDVITDDIRTRALMSRVAFALASAEVFLTLYQKQQVREKMNEYLLLIAPKSTDG